MWPNMFSENNFWILLLQALLSIAALTCFSAGILHYIICCMWFCSVRKYL
jgi:hypothetical protein